MHNFASLQLQCDKRNISAHIGGEFILICTYDTNLFLYSKKYWCRGDSRITCEILLDSESETIKTHKSHIIDARRRGLILKVTDLQVDDSGVYWVGINKMSADIMTSVNVVITEVPVSKPRLEPLSSLADGLTCRGRPVAVRCGCTKGTGVAYAWYQRTLHKEFLIHKSSDLHLQCGTVRKDSDYYCVANNDISSQRSDVISVQVLMPADRSCIYVVTMPGQPFYDCDDRMNTTTAKPPPPTTCRATTKIHSDTGNTSLPINQTDQELFFSSTQRYKSEIQKGHKEKEGL
ncbi:high affinity immunoglobulin alpha and immunoglobulin mu Fc receptor [Clinocottus analis]|uniref:high affinity immunoglobulin alpha and immunoglobulin mu Fc receptor n=1 Tax=Clinocottus analis TaxID=304258 RepID=UPI0035BFB328